MNSKFVLPLTIFLVTIIFGAASIFLSYKFKPEQKAAVPGIFVGEGCDANCNNCKDSNAWYQCHCAKGDSDPFCCDKGSCFLPGTKVLMADGVSKNIEDIKAGETVLSFNKDGKTVTSLVREPYSVTRQEYYEVVLDNGTVLKVTDEHPFLTDLTKWKNGSAQEIVPAAKCGEGNLEPGFTRTRNLKIGDRVYVLVKDQLQETKVKKIDKISKTVPVYNLKLEDNFTYFAENVAVHNKGELAVGLGKVYCQDPGGPIIVIPGVRIRLDGVVHAPLPEWNNRSVAVEGTTNSSGVYDTSSFPWPQNPATALQNGWLKPNARVVSLPATLPAGITNPNFRTQNPVPVAVNCSIGAGVCHNPTNVCSADSSFYKECNLSGAGLQKGTFDFKYTNCTVIASFSCSSLGPAPTNPQPGQQLTFACTSTASNTTVNHFNFRVNSGTATKVNPSTTNPNQASFTYTVPTTGANFTVQCQVCTSSDDATCTAWGQAN